MPEEILHQQRMLLHNCDRLKLSVSRHQSKGLSLSGGQNMADVVEVVTKLAANFTKLIELMLSKEIKVRVPSDTIELYWNILFTIHFSHSNFAPEDMGSADPYLHNTVNTSE